MLESIKALELQHQSQEAWNGDAPGIQSADVEAVLKTSEEDTSEPRIVMLEESHAIMEQKVKLLEEQLFSIQKVLKEEGLGVQKMLSPPEAEHVERPDVEFEEGEELKRPVERPANPSRDVEAADSCLVLLEARVAAVEALIPSEQKRAQAWLGDAPATSVPSSEFDSENCKDHHPDGVAQKQQKALAPQHLDISYTLEHQAMQLDALFTLEPSAWESAIFIGLAPIKKRGTVLLLIALITNITIQVLLSVLIERSFPSVPVDIEAVEQWRHVIGHHISEVDAFGYSLVGKVCGRHPTLSVAKIQRDILESARAYMKDDFDGPALCIVVIIIHYLFWMKDSERTATFMKELWHIPVSTTTRILPSNDEMLFLVSLPLTRKLFMYVVCLGRLAVATMLLARGTLWLVYTISITDLVLNAVALEFIYDVDELLYNVCATKVTSVMLERTRIQACAASRKDTPFRGTLASLRVFSLAAFTIAVFCMYVYPNALILKDVVETICGGENDFALAEHNDLGIMLYAPTISSSVDIRMRDSAVWKVADEIIEGKIVSSMLKLPDIARMSSLLSKDVDQVADAVMATCKDSSPSDLPYFWQSVQQDLNIAGGDIACENVSKACSSPSLHLVRMLCPETCRCYYARPSTAISKGCPLYKCLESSTAAMFNMYVSCKDNSVDFLATNMYWASFWKSLNASKSLEGSADSGEVVDYAMTFGCSVISTYQLFEELCVDVAGRHSLGTFCPQACKCRSNEFWGCPAKCYRGGYR